MNAFFPLSSSPLYPYLARYISCIAAKWITPCPAELKDKAPPSGYCIIKVSEIKNPTYFNFLSSDDAMKEQHVSEVKRILDEADGSTFFNWLNGTHNFVMYKYLP